MHSKPLPPHCSVPVGGCADIEHVPCSLERRLVKSGETESAKAVLAAVETKVPYLHRFVQTHIHS